MKPVCAYIILFVWLCGLPVHTTAYDRGLDFIANRGQWPQQVQYKANVAGGAVFFTPSSFRYLFYNTEQIAALHDQSVKGTLTGKETVNGHAYAVRFAESNTPVIEAGTQRPYHHNYYYGNNPSGWASHVPLFEQVTYNGLYEGIDLQVYSNNTSMKYDFVVRPGADATNIKLVFEGVIPALMEDGSLRIKTTVNTVTEAAPYAYQDIDGQRREVTCNYRVEGRTVSFDIPDGYNKNYPLVIDPVLDFATYSGSTGDLYGYCTAFDAYGNYYSGSEAWGGGYPVTTGAFQVNYVFHDVAISKYNADGSQLLYATYYGGSDWEHPMAMKVNNNDQLVVCGFTYSANLPMPTSAVDKTYNGKGDLFVAVFNSDGTALLGATYLGGQNEDGRPYPELNNEDANKCGLDIDGQNNIYIGSVTKSKDYPVSNNALQLNHIADRDGCVTKLNNDCSKRMYSTFLGGDHIDCVFDCRLKDNGQLVVCGLTVSDNFPVTAGAYSDTGKGFISIINTSGTALVASTRLGVHTRNAIRVSMDDAGNIFACGNNDTLYTATPGAYSEHKGRIYIAKLTPGLDTLIRSTKLVTSGTPGVVCFNNICGDVLGVIYVQDSTSLPLTSNALQTTNASFYIFHMSPAMDSFIYASYYGLPNTRDMHVHGTGVIDTLGRLWLPTCNNKNKHLFPGTPGSYCMTSKNGGANDNLFARFDLEVKAVKPVAKIVAPDTICENVPVTFGNQSANAYSYMWDFGDGDTSYLQTPSHTFTSGGPHKVRLSAFNSYSCRYEHVAEKIIQVDSVAVYAGFSAQDTLCLGKAVHFNNTSIRGIRYKWDFGDGATDTTADAQHIYAAAGVYYPKLYAYNIELCNDVDSMVKPVVVSDSRPGAGFTVDRDTACAGMPVQFTNTTLDGTTYIWDFADGNTAVTKDAVHSYTAGGTYQVKLIASNQTKCFTKDTATLLVYIPDPLTVNLPDTFICGDSPVAWTVRVEHAGPAVQYKWAPAAAVISATSQQRAIVDPSVTTQYFVTVTDTVPGLCRYTITDTGNLIIVKYPDSTYALANTPICERETLQLFSGTALNVPGIVYTWSGPGGFSEAGRNVQREQVNRAQSGRYIVAIDNQGCTSFTHVDVAIKPVPDVSITSNSPILAGADLRFSMKSDLPPDSIRWSGPAGFSSTEKQPVIPGASHGAEGSYTLSVFVNGCMGGAVTYAKINAPDSQYIRLYPNPNSGIFYIEGKGQLEQEIKIIVTNAIGQKLFYVQTLTHDKYFKEQITLPELADGVYFVRVLMDGRYWPLPFNILHE